MADKLNDGLIIPGSEYPLGTPLRTVRRAAASRAPLRGTVRAIVVLVDFTEAPMAASPAHFRDLFFSTRKIPAGSVREYFTEASHGLLTLAGEVVGPYRLPRTLTAYAGGKAGTENPEPNARTMARDAAQLANPDVNCGNAELVQQLLESGAAVDCHANDGTTALMPASANGFTEIVRALILKEADVTAARGGSKRVSSRSSAGMPTPSRCSSKPRSSVESCCKPRPRVTIWSSGKCSRWVRRSM